MRASADPPRALPLYSRRCRSGKDFPGETAAKLRRLRLRLVKHAVKKPALKSNSCACLRLNKIGIVVSFILETTMKVFKLSLCPPAPTVPDNAPLDEDGDMCFTSNAKAGGFLEMPHQIVEAHNNGKITR